MPLAQQMRAGAAGAAFEAATAAAVCAAATAHAAGGAAVRRCAARRGTHGGAQRAMTRMRAEPASRVAAASMAQPLA